MATIDNTTQESLYTLAVKVLSKYDVSDKDIQAFIKNVTKNIKIKKTENTDQYVNNLNKNTDNVFSLSTDTKAFFEKIFNTTTNESPEPTSISKDLFKQRDLVGVVSELFKKRPTEKNQEPVSYFKELLTAFKEGGFTKAKNTLFEPRDNTDLIKPTKSAPQQYQKFSYFDDPVANNSIFTIDGFTSKGEDQLRDILNDSLSKIKIPDLNSSNNSQSNKSSFSILDFLRRRNTPIPRSRGGRPTPRSRGGKPAPKTKSGKPAPKTKSGKPAPKTKSSKPTPKTKPQTPKTKPPKTKPQTPPSTKPPKTKPQTPPSTKPPKTKPQTSPSTKPPKIKPPGRSSINKNTAKQAGKLGTKQLGKSLTKKIPIAGALFGLGYGLDRALSGDFTGAGLEVLSGAAGAFPGLGTGVSTAIDASLFGRDLSTTLNTDQNEPVTSSLESIQSPSLPSPPVQDSTETPTITVKKTKDTPWPVSESLSPKQPPLIPTPELAPLPSTTKESSTENIDNSILDTIAKNTNNTNEEIKHLTRAIMNLANTFAQATLNNKNTSTVATIPSQPLIQKTPAAVLAATNFDPIRNVRNKFLI